MIYPKQLEYIIAEDPSSYEAPTVKPAHFLWSPRKDIAALRKAFVGQFIFSSIELWIVIFIICTLYFGSGHNPSRYASNIDVNIVDFDGNVAGSFFLNAFRNTAPGNATLHWHYKQGSDYNYDLNKVEHEVLDGKVWAAVILLSNTTALINGTLASYLNATTALTSPFIFAPPILVKYESGRNAFSINNYILPPIRAAVGMGSAQYGAALRRALTAQLSASSNGSYNRTIQLINIFQLGSLLTGPLTAKSQDLHPGSPFVGQLATTLAYVYIYLVTGLTVGAALKFLPTFAGKVHWVDLLTFRIVNGVFQGFMISLIFSLIVYWYFDIDSGRVFMRYWMFNWLSCLLFSLVVSLFLVNLGPLGNSLLICFVILMLAGATIQLTPELSPRFYRYGYGLPLYHIMNGGRHLLFKSHSRFGIDVGVLVLYFVVFWIFAVISSAVRLHKQQKKLLEKQGQTKTDKRKYPIATIARR